MDEKPIAWLRSEIKSPAFSREARMEAGFLLGLLQAGELLGPPQADPMPEIGPRCWELKVRDRNVFWRVIYRIDLDAIVVALIFSKKTRKTPNEFIELARRRFAEYDEA